MGERKPVGHKGSGSGASGKMSGQSSLDPVENDAGLLGEAALEPGLQAYIGEQLRSVYEEVLNEAVPDRFLVLLQELERKQAGNS
jgi:hypothetical protein